MILNYMSIIQRLNLKVSYENKSFELYFFFSIIINQRKCSKSVCVYTQGVQLLLNYYENRKTIEDFSAQFNPLYISKEVMRLLSDTRYIREK